MFKFLFKMIKKDFKEIDRYQYEEGYNHAAGQLLKEGSLAADFLKAFVASEIDFGRTSPFEDGVLNAISDYEKLCNKLVSMEVI